MANDQRRRFPWKRPESIYDDAGPREGVLFEMDGHRLNVQPTNETGSSTGRTRYFVRCETCDDVLHEATTGPASIIEDHLGASPHEQKIHAAAAVNGEALRVALLETLDWINIRALAAGRIAELLAYAMSSDQPALGMLSTADLERLQRRVAEWLPGQPPRSQQDVHNGHEVARLTRELDKAREVIHGKIRMAKETSDE